MHESENRKKIGPAIASRMNGGRVCFLSEPLLILTKNERKRFSQPSLFFAKAPNNFNTWNGEVRETIGNKVSKETKFIVPKEQRKSLEDPSNDTRVGRYFISNAESCLMVCDLDGFSIQKPSDLFLDKFSFDLDEGKRIGSNSTHNIKQSGLDIVKKDADFFPLESFIFSYYLRDEFLDMPLGGGKRLDHIHHVGSWKRLFKDVIEHWQFSYNNEKTPINRKIIDAELKIFDTYNNFYKFIKSILDKIELSESYGINTNSIICEMQGSLSSLKVPLIDITASQRSFIQTQNLKDALESPKSEKYELFIAHVGMAHISDILEVLRKDAPELYSNCQMGVLLTGPNSASENAIKKIDPNIPIGYIQ